MDTADSAIERPSVPLSVLLDDEEYGAQALSPTVDGTQEGAPAADRLRDIPVSASIVIELADPGPYLLPGDLLLITGLGLPREAAEIDLYVERIKASGVAAIVFGIEPVYSEVPAALIAACRRQGFPLIALPPHVYFAPLSMRLNRALETERTRALADMNSLARKLTAAALQHRPAQRVLSVLAQAGNGWALLRIGDETITAGSPPEPSTTEELLAELQHRFTQQAWEKDAVPTVFTTVEDDGELYEITAHSNVPARSRSRAAEFPAILALARSPRLTNTDRTALMLAAQLLELVVQLPADQSMALDQLLMHFMVESTPHLAASTERDRFVRLLSSSFGGGSRTAHAVVAIRDPRAALAPGAATRDTAAASDALWLRRLLRTPFVEHRSQRLRAYVAQAPGEAEYAQASALGWLLATSEPHGFSELREAMLEAEELSRATRHLGRHVGGADPEAFAAAWPLAAATDPALARTAAAGWLAPLAGEEHAEARRTLEVWLRQHGSWDRAARALGVHRNTVRRLIAEAQRRLGRDLDDPVERARILLALAVLASDE